MKNNITKLLIFVCGAAIGSAATWKFVKTKYERIAQEEIDSVKEVFRNKQQHLMDLNKNKIELDVYKRILDKAKYDSGVTEEELEVKQEEPEVDEEDTTKDPYIITEEEAIEEIKTMKSEGIDVSNMYVPPYVITPSDFDEYDDYETETLNYFEDGVLATIFGEVIPEEDVDEIVGNDPFSHFGEYEKDTVYVRNDNRKIDYEILRDSSKYSDLYGNDDTEIE